MKDLRLIDIRGISKYSESISDFCRNTRFRWSIIMSYSLKS